MKTLKDFYAFTNLKGRVASLAIMLILTSFLYCSIFSMANSVAYRSGTIALYYIFLYIIVMVAAYVYMIIMFQFVRNKRQDTKSLRMKDYRLPLFGVQTILYILMAGSNYISLQLLFTNQQLNAYVMTPVMILLTMLYIPVQVFACFRIYDGERNPFVILKNAVWTIVKHFQACFYSLLPLLLLAVIYSGIMNMVFDYSTTFSPASAVLDIMTGNPFLNGFYLGLAVFDNISLLPATIVSFVYGVIMCIVLVFYYTFMVCIADEDIHI